MKAKLTAETASLKTVVVEVKALVIGKRQVTLAVFRQLPKEDIFDFEGTLKGVPWGHVNYFWGALWGDFHAEATVHHNIIWQREDQLLRCIVSSHDYALGCKPAGYNKAHKDPIREGNQWCNYKNRYIVNGLSKKAEDVLACVGVYVDRDEDSIMNIPVKDRAEYVRKLMDQALDAQLAEKKRWHDSYTKLTSGLEQLFIAV